MTIHDHGTDQEPVQLPVVVLAPEDELAAAAVENAETKKMQHLLAFVGDGRPIDEEGELGEEAMAELATAVGVDDADENAALIRLAAAAGLVEAADGRIVRTEAGTAAADNVLDSWWETFNAYLGLVSETVAEGAVGELIELTVTQALLLLYCEAEPVTHKDLLSTTWSTARKALEDVLAGQAKVRKAMKEVVEETVTQVMSGLEAMGAVRIIGKDRHHLSLTPLGAWATRRLLLEGPFIAPVAGDLSLEDADVVLRAAGEMRPEVTDAELRAWCDARGATNAAKELVAAARAADEPGERMMAIYALGFTGAGAEASVRELLEVPELAPLAHAWLVDQGVADVPPLDADAAPAAMVESLAVILAVGGPATVADTLGELGAPSAQAGVVENLWRVESPHTTSVLEAIADGHPDKGVAKAARKALFKRRSAGK
jgi:hypothetical protein